MEVFLIPGSCDDGEGLHGFAFVLRPGSQVVGDKAYNNCAIEDQVAEADIHPWPFRKKNSKRQVPRCAACLQFHDPKKVETTGSFAEYDPGEKNPCR